MGKFESLEKEIYSVFGSDAWKSEGINTFPNNFLKLNAGTEFIRVSIVPGGKSVNAISVAGILIIDIFIPAGGGPRRASLIADKLDKYLANKSLGATTNKTQFRESSLVHKGVDKDNATLHMSSYTIPFTYFGAF